VVEIVALLVMAMPTPGWLPYGDWAPPNGGARRPGRVLITKGHLPVTFRVTIASRMCNRAMRENCNVHVDMKNVKEMEEHRCVG